LDVKEPRLKTPEECDLLIQVGTGQVRQETMHCLKDILERHPGPTQVKLKLRTSDEIKVFLLPQQYKVSPDGALYAEVLSLLGEGCLALE
jgi:DNA polymerase-3 subunit alpha